jgi:hypothetical protein
VPGWRALLLVTGEELLAVAAEQEREPGQVVPQRGQLVAAGRSGAGHAISA